MAAGQGYKEFSTGDILTAADANGYLASQVVMVFADAAARTSGIASPQEGMISYLKDTNSTEYYSGSAWAAIGAGGASGKILQVVQATYSTQTTIASTTYTDTGLSATITPSATSSKVLVLVQQFNSRERNGTGMGSGINLVRGSTTIYSGNSRNTAGYMSASINGGSVNAVNLMTMTPLHYLDSPATTSATTYKTQIAALDTSASGTAYAQTESNMSTIILMEVGA
jgi:hypothetical protein